MNCHGNQGRRQSTARYLSRRPPYTALQRPTSEPNPHVSGTTSRRPHDPNDAKLPDNRETVGRWLQMPGIRTCRICRIRRSEYEKACRSGGLGALPAEGVAGRVMGRTRIDCKAANCVDRHNLPRLLSLMKCSYCDDFAEKISRVHRRHPRSAILQMSLVSCCSVSNQAAAGVVPGDRWLFLCEVSGWVCLMLWNPCADCRRVLSVVQGSVPGRKKRSAELQSEVWCLRSAECRGKRPEEQSARPPSFAV